MEAHKAQEAPIEMCRVPNKNQTYAGSRDRAGSMPKEQPMQQRPNAAKGSLATHTHTHTAIGRQLPIEKVHCSLEGTKKRKKTMRNESKSHGGG